MQLMASHVNLIIAARLNQLYITNTRNSYSLPFSDCKRVGWFRLSNFDKAYHHPRMLLQTPDI